MANIVNSKPLMEPPQLTRPIPVYDTSKSVAQNMAGQGTPSANNIFAAMRTPTAQLQMQQPVQQPAVPTPQPQEQTKTQPAITNMDELAAAMGYTSPEEEEKLRKASVANRRILAVADAIRHIGNIANTINYAPAQQFNSPVAEEQARYERGKAMRDKANLVYMNYQQAKAAQDAKQRQWESEQQQKSNQWNATFNFNREKALADLAEKQRQYDTTLDFNKGKQKAIEDRWNRIDAETFRHHGATEANSRATLAETRRHHGVIEANGGVGGKVERRDTRRGYLTKRGATAGEIESTYHQMYEWGKRHKDPKTGKPYIDEAALKGQMTYGTYSFGGSSITQDLKERAVNQMLMEHDDAAVRMHTKYGWEWHEQTPNDKKKQSIEGFGGGSTSTKSGLQKIPGFGGN